MFILAEFIEALLKPIIELVNCFKGRSVFTIVFFFVMLAALLATCSFKPQTENTQNSQEIQTPGNCQQPEPTQEEICNCSLGENNG